MLNNLTINNPVSSHKKGGVYADRTLITIHNLCGVERLFPVDPWVINLTIKK